MGVKRLLEVSCVNDSGIYGACYVKRGSFRDWRSSLSGYARSSSGTVTYDPGSDLFYG